MDDNKINDSVPANETQEDQIQRQTAARVQNSDRKRVIQTDSVQGGNIEISRVRGRLKAERVISRVKSGLPVR